MSSTAELKRKVLDLASELEQARAAKAERDNQVSELRNRLLEYRALRAAARS